MAGRGGADNCEVSPQDLDDIRFAQAQIRSFAEVQKAALRDAEVGDLIGAIVFPASDAAAMMTGSALLADGGWTAI